MRTWHLIWSMHFPPNDWSRRNENICQLREKNICENSQKYLCKTTRTLHIVPEVRAPGWSASSRGRAKTASCVSRLLTVGGSTGGDSGTTGLCAGHLSPPHGYPAHSDTDGRHTQLFQVCFNHVIFQSLNSFGFFAYEYTSWWIYFNRNDKTLLLSSIRFYENWTKKWPPWGYKNVFSKCACVCLKLLQCPAKGRRLSGWWNEN